MRSSFLSRLALRWRRTRVAVFGLMSKDDWLFLASIVLFHSLLIALIWVVFLN
ncbi:hypothetical protein ACVIGA_002946 [Bradyrhizobium sp. USDA 3240]